ARVINYFMKCDEIILQHGLASTFSTSTGKKEKCRMLKKHLEPAALRDGVEAHHRIVDSSGKSDENALYLLVKEKALEQEKVFQLLAKRKQQPPSRTHDGGKPKRGHDERFRQDGKRGSSGKDAHNGNNGGGQARNNSGGSSQGRTVFAPREAAEPNPKSKPRSGYFHCGKDHWLSQCPDLDEAGKEALLAERTKKRVASDGNGKRFRAKRVETTTKVADYERPTVIINGVFQLPYCADSGSDTNIISRYQVEQLCAVDATVTPVKLSEPVSSRAVGGAILTST
ncbi:hypothetical protein PF005_g32791, partial [Phytophthora fragariae]